MSVTDQIATVIRSFPFWDYGMSDVDPNDRYAEWVTDLAARIANEVTVDPDHNEDPDDTERKPRDDRP